MLVHSLPVENTKGLAQYVKKDASDTAAGLVHDVTDTDCQSQNGSAHGHVFFDFRMSILSKVDHKSTDCSECIFCFIPIDRTRDALSRGVHCKESVC